MVVRNGGGGEGRGEEVGWGREEAVVAPKYFQSMDHLGTHYKTSPYIHFLKLK